MAQAPQMIDGSICVGLPPGDRSRTEPESSGDFMGALLESLYGELVPQRQFEKGVGPDSDATGADGFFAFNQSAIRTAPANWVMGPNPVETFGGLVDSSRGAEAGSSEPRQLEGRDWPGDEAASSSRTAEEPGERSGAPGDTDGVSKKSDGSSEVQAKGEDGQPSKDAEDTAAPEEPEIGEASVREGAGHGVEALSGSRADAAHGIGAEVREGAAHVVSPAGAPVEDAVLNAFGPWEQGPALPTVAAADGVSPVAFSTSTGATGEGATGVGAQAGGRSSNAPEGGPGEASGLDRFDGALKEALRTARLPMNVRERIELARSIGRQVIRSATVGVKDGRTEVVLQLRPPSLGSVQMQLSSEGKAVSVRLTVGNELVRGIVEEHLSALRSVLRDEGFRLDQFEVSVRSETGAESWASAQADGGDRNAVGSDGDEGGESRERADDVPPAAGTQEVSAHDGSVDYLA